MTSPDMDVIKEIPGYKVILKAILKSQIQQLVEQLADHTEEESIILTASVSDGTLSHLGSDSGKSFLEDHEDVKSQFLGFCLKFHHKKKQEKERKEQEEKEMQLLQQQQAAAAQQRAQFSPRGPSYPHRMAFSPRFPSPRQQMIRSPGARHEPYPVSRPIRRTSLNFGARGRGGTGAMRLPHKVDNQVIKIEAEDPDDSSNQSGGDSGGTPRRDSLGEAASDPSQPSSPSHQQLNPAHVKAESASERDDDAKSNTSSTSTIPNEASELNKSSETGSVTQPQEGLSFDSDLSALAATSDSGGKVSGGGDDNDGVSVKLESISESEMELEITGVEPGRSLPPTPGTSGGEVWPQGGAGMVYSPGATGTQQDMQAAGYRLNEIKDERDDDKAQINTLPLSTQDSTEVKPSVSPIGKDTLQCPLCPYSSKNRSNLYRHKMAVHEKRKYACKICTKEYTDMYYLREHITTEHDKVLFLCEICSKSFKSRRNLNLHKSNKHGDGGRFTCEYCGKILTAITQYQGHVNKHKGSQPYKCAKCSKSFFYKSSLHRHKISCGGDKIDKKNYRCTECDKMYKSSNALNDHIKGKHGQKDKRCKCGKSFAWRMSLARHIKTCKIAQ